MDTLSHHSNKEGENTTNAGNSHITNSGYSSGVQSVPQSEQPSTLSCESWQRWHLEEVLYSPRATVLDFDLEVLGLAFLQGKEEVFFLPAFLRHWRHSKTGTSLPVLRVQKPLTKKTPSSHSTAGKSKKEKHCKLAGNYSSLPDLVHGIFTFNITAELLKKKKKIYKQSVLFLHVITWAAVNAVRI